MTTERLFIALWPDPAVRTALAALAADAARDGRAVGAESLHLTLIFLGSTDAVRRASVERVCDAVRAPGFELALVEVGGRGRSGVVWAAPAQVPEPLVGLVGELKAGLGRCGFAPETRPFRAHVTLARDVRRRIAPRAIAAIQWKVSDFCLVSSRPGVRGSVYAIERTWPLGVPG